MRIKLAVLDKDDSYLSRFVSALSSRYADSVEIYSFTNLSNAIQSLDDLRIDVFLADDSFDIDFSAIPKRCGFAYFMATSEEGSMNDQRVIGKYQRIEQIYKQILGIYSENSAAYTGVRPTDDSVGTVAFMPVSGGCGASTMAAACAIYQAQHGKRTLYLNLEAYGASDMFFQGDGASDMSDIIFALKSRKSNLMLKLESCVRQDPSGVFFFSASQNALDMAELSDEDVRRFLSELRMSGSYDCIVLDLDFALDSRTLKILQDVQSVIWVGDGSEISNQKLVRIYQTLQILDQDSDNPLLSRLHILYNKFSSHTSSIPTEVDLKSIGGAPRYEHATTKMILEQLSQMSMFASIV